MVIECLYGEMFILGAFVIVIIYYWIELLWPKRRKENYIELELNKSNS